MERRAVRAQRKVFLLFLLFHPFALLLETQAQQSVRVRPAGVWASRKGKRECFWSEQTDRERSNKRRCRTAARGLGKEPLLENEIEFCRVAVGRRSKFSDSNGANMANVFDNLFLSSSSTETPPNVDGRLTVRSSLSGLFRLPLSSISRRSAHRWRAARVGRPQHQGQVADPPSKGFPQGR